MKTAEVSNVGVDVWSNLEIAARKRNKELRIFYFSAMD